MMLMEELAQNWFQGPFHLSQKMLQTNGVKFLGLPRPMVYENFVTSGKREGKHYLYVGWVKKNNFPNFYYLFIAKSKRNISFL